ncbi:hypothetical protein TIFTF001_016221 [Ficus carica]|uniref:Uncharacterized protein n=1 Tax=Ficus carica TaxID=3494 RepID=A0AA88AN91_FICCA|nr:hypothetical protein TIFTF001_016221 [Ficus carica]
MGTGSGSSFRNAIEVGFWDQGVQDQDQGWVLRLGMGSSFDIQSKGWILSFTTKSKDWGQRRVSEPRQRLGLRNGAWVRFRDSFGIGVGGWSLVLVLGSGFITGVGIGFQDWDKGWVRDRTEVGFKAQGRVEDEFWDMGRSRVSGLGLGFGTVVGVKLRDMGRYRVLEYRSRSVSGLGSGSSFITKSRSGFRMGVWVEFQVGRVSGSGFGIEDQGKVLGRGSGVEVRFRNGDRSRGWVSVWWSRLGFGMGVGVGF